MENVLKIERESFMRKKTKLDCLSVLLMAIVLSAGFTAGEALAETKVTIGLNSDARTLDPVLTNDATTIRILRHVYDALFFRDKDMKVVPELAESYEMIDDTTWLIKLNMS